MDLRYETPPGSVKVRAAHEGDLDTILAIRNHAIEHGTALWTDTPQTRDEGAAWLGAHLGRGSAYVAEDTGDGTVVGFGVYGPWKDYSGFRHTVENSVYVAEGHHGRGIGSALLGTLVASASATGLHVMIAGIEAGNGASVRLHERHGFEHAGTVREVGTKFGRWLDLTLMRRQLD
ncbi:GNAT family N-acetyltransferase [Streptomyces sp. VRA16 Mangrove soil]|uniref:GNAT family N-acetyltransferase n=1 Tax=Streptomyces sp. VRA16 Mangrove soil TaxID=2817434 RepID=UPI001A9CE4D3|nr:GNAT family N-acetyltransferase [Streptomyces sp. VRA16 Mangrove soil]MBO1332264.1 N-acetyltransferase [Streptomyces sp. VRA16 Mangrove soil]